MLKMLLWQLVLISNEHAERALSAKMKIISMGQGKSLTIVIVIKEGVQTSTIDGDLLRFDDA